MRATSEKIVNSKLRRLVGDSAVSYLVVGRKTAPRRCGPAVVPDLAEAGASVLFQGRTIKLGRTGVRKCMVSRDVVNAE